MRVAFNYRMLKICISSFALVFIVNLLNRDNCIRPFLYLLAAKIYLNYLSYNFLIILLGVYGL